MTVGGSEYFDPRFNQDNIDDGIEQQQQETGVIIGWYFYDEVHSIVSETFDEGGDTAAGGLRWNGPFPLPVLQASRIEGEPYETDLGFYTMDSVTMIMGYRQATNSGLSPAPDVTNEHLRDRFVWEDRVWQPDNIQARNLLGGGGTRATIIIRATQVKPDEMNNDPDFQQWAEESLLVQSNPNPEQD
jgi:hypothetical protein